MRQKALFLGLLVFTAANLLAQEPIEMNLPEIPDSSVFQQKADSKTERKFHTGVSLDMSYIFSKNYSGPMMSFSPYISYPVSERLSLSAGITAGYGSLYAPFLLSEKNEGKLMPMTQTFIYASGSYKLNSKLTITGSVYKGVNSIPNLKKQHVPSDYDYSGVSMGFNYKIAPGVSFGAEIRVNNSNPFSYGTGLPYNNSGYYNPYGW